MTSFAVATEDQLSETVAELLLAQTGNFSVAQRLRRDGFGYLKRQCRSFDKVARNVMPVLLLTDLDNAPCPPALIAAWLPNAPHRRLLFRVAVREVESWLIADRKAIADFLGVPLAKVPNNPDELPNPKQTLLGLVRRCKSRAIKKDILPADPGTSQVGLGYNDQLSRFVREQWKCTRAAKASPSLARAVACLERFDPTTTT
jgi:hypothetical protein